MAELHLWQRDILILLLLGWSNFLPILGRVVLKERLSAPLDLGYKWIDNRYLLGPHKTWRGIIISVIGTGLAGHFTPLGLALGLKLATCSMSGDLISSFAKRRMGFKSGSKALLLDQGLESFLPLWVLKDSLFICWTEIILIISSFTLLEIGISPLLRRLHIRRSPH
ncbi:MAG: CDP-archaeol synthase [Deltaproteobacteria bacterium]|nr:CDP-archaeol synthase [Deltaproteobacteria bacterium]MDL1960775.1 CDP-archaeol synthase [Deltaproteobacteria bacterium]